ncbi:MAG TPA: NAD(P)/FAD-dependent oxidoreductase [Rectinemataceae bacterium]|nr:NAD(P)/FAD-dependent oxidoreductase [Rectinemataceae bacterium]
MDGSFLVVGGGMAGLCAAAYLAREGEKVRLLEKEPNFGGLVNSFTRDGFTWDGGIRALEDSGIVLPMLRELGIELEWLPNEVSVAFGDDLLRIKGRESLADYRELLHRRFPALGRDIDRIIADIGRVMGYMDVLYGIENPLFHDLGDLRYLRDVVFPWALKYLATLPALSRYRLPVEERLARLTSDRPLADMIGQHFFKRTPASFALSYFSLYLSYRYPRGGTGGLSAAVADFDRSKDVEMLAGRKALRIDVAKRILVDDRGEEHHYEGLVWAADLSTLYGILDEGGIEESRVRRRIGRRRDYLADKRGGESVFTVYLEVALPPESFETITSPHLFWTPFCEGLSSLDRWEIEERGLGGSPAMRDDSQRLRAWLDRYLELTSYEISIPALRDPSLAPPGHTGLIVSTLMDYAPVARLKELGAYEVWKKEAIDRVVGLLDGGIFPGLAAALRAAFASSPLTIERLSGNRDGAITGWAFTNTSMPAVSSMPGIANSVRTPIPGIVQAGQWSYSPSGMPIAILTGKLAAGRLLAESRRRR